MGIYMEERRHKRPLITFLSARVNARCILLIETTVFITSNGPKERKRGGEKESERGRHTEEMKVDKSEEHFLMKK